MVDIGSGAKRTTRDYQLSRYACYLIVQNSDASKLVIANGQTYFTIQTRRQELQSKGFIKPKLRRRRQTPLPSPQCTCTAGIVEM